MFTTISFLLYRLAAFSILFAEEAKASDFDDFGILLLAGGAMAIGVGIVFAVVRSKSGSTVEQRTPVISIKPPEN